MQSQVYSAVLRIPEGYNSTLLLRASNTSAIAKKIAHHSSSEVSFACEIISSVSSLIDKKMK